MCCLVLIHLHCDQNMFVMFSFFTTQAVDYDGGRTLDDLVQYVEKQVGGETEEETGEETEEETGEEEETEEDTEEETEEDSPEDSVEEEEPKKDEL